MILSFLLAGDRNIWLWKPPSKKSVNLVAIDGKILIRNGHITKMNVDEIVKNSEAAFERMYEEINI